jgi:hypothetical protein
MRSGDKPPDSTADEGDGARWMSFAELASTRQISKASAIKLIRRHHWRRQRDNEGRVRALVPAAWATPETPVERDREPDSTADISRAISALQDALVTLREAKDAEIAGLREAQAREIANLREAHGRALGTLRDDQDRLLATLRDEHGRLVAVLEAKAQAAEDRAEQIEARAEQTERGEQFERARAEELTARMAAERRVQAEEMARLHHQLDEARAGEAELTALRHADELRRARGIVARLRAAWRGE